MAEQIIPQDSRSDRLKTRSAFAVLALVVAALSGFVLGWICFLVADSHYPSGIWQLIFGACGLGAVSAWLAARSRFSRIWPLWLGAVALGVVGFFLLLVVTWEGA